MREAPANRPRTVVKTHSLSLSKGTSRYIEKRVEKMRSNLLLLLLPMPLSCTQAVEETLSAYRGAYRYIIRIIYRYDEEGARARAKRVCIALLKREQSEQQKKKRPELCYYYALSITIRNYPCVAKCANNNCFSFSFAPLRFLFEAAKDAVGTSILHTPHPTFVLSLSFNSLKNKRKKEKRQTRTFA